MNKMNKEKNKISGDKIVLLICAIFFGIVSIIIWQQPVLKFYQEGITLGSYLKDITGFQLAFGGTVYRCAVGPYPPTPFHLNACPLATVTLMLIIVGFITSIISFVLTLKNNKSTLLKVLIIVSISCYLIGGIMCFFLEQSFAISDQSEELSYFKNKMVNNYNVGPFYAIIAITCSFLTSLQIIYLKKK